MAIRWFNKTIVCGTIAISALFYYVIILRNLKKNKEINKTDDNIVFEIKIINPHLPNIHNGKQVFGRSPLILKQRAIKTKCSQNKMHPRSIQPLRNKKLFSVKLKIEKGYNLIILNNLFFIRNYLLNKKKRKRKIERNITFKHHSRKNLICLFQNFFSYYNSVICVENIIFIRSVINATLVNTSKNLETRCRFFHDSINLFYNK
ncbi:hypothetical protein ACFW04_002664 [Cataglyphis niger]